MSWVHSGVLRPHDYDRDIAELIRRAIGEASDSDAETLSEAMDRVGWAAHDLLRAVYPALQSFSGMLRELLALYARVDATRAGDEDLEIQYEFEDGESIDEELKPFRKCVERVERSIQVITSFRFTNAIGWHSPFERRAIELELLPKDLARSLLGLAPGSSLRDWPFSAEIPSPPHVNTSKLARVIADHRQVITAALHRLNEFGTDVNTAVLHPDASESERDLYFASTDFWAPSQIVLMNLAPQLLADLPRESQDRLLQEQSEWLGKFWERTNAPVEQSIQDVSDVLSLPHWGRRHELYAAWVVAAIDRALGARLRFDVSDGVLCFPFRATLLARLVTAFGDVELWTEKRFKASGSLAGGRKQGIQPDLTFLDAASPHLPIAAVEAKQYLRSSGLKHGLTARDYARNLPSAQVLMVGHGPLGDSAIRHVRAEDRLRVTLYPHVRPGHSAVRDQFESHIVALFPEPSTPSAAAAPPMSFSVPPLDDSASEVDPSHRNELATVALTWAVSVHDLDPHLIRDETGDEVYYGRPASAHAVLNNDGFNGGPEWVVVTASPGPVRIEVRLFSGEVANVAGADPRVTTTMLGFHAVLRAGHGSGTERTWHVATIDAHGLVRLGDGVIVATPISP